MSIELKIEEAIKLSQKIVDLCNSADDNPNHITLQVESNALRIRDALKIILKTKLETL